MNEYPTWHIWYWGKQCSRPEIIKEKKITAAFLDQLYFVIAKANTPEIGLSAYEESTNENKILNVANIIKKDIL